MWQLIWFLQGYVIAEIRGASPEWSLEKLSGARVAFLKPQRTDDFTIRLVLLQRDLPKARTAAQRAMCELCVLQEHGFRQVFGGLWKRRGFALLLLLAMAGAFVIPKFVFFYEVVGNETVPEAQILRELQNLGVGFGTYGPSIRPQELKNRMLLQIPKLQWLTVQQSGMRACVVVRERPEAIAVEERRAPMNVVAGKDGVITSVLAMEGNCLCAVGQAVKKGQVLISAYTDLEFTTRVCAALGEVYAETLAQKTARCPDTVLQKTPNGKNSRSVSLLVGEKRWNIFANGGNSDGRCDKITKTHMLTLPLGLTLPVGLEIVEQRGYDLTPAPLEKDAAEKLLEQQVTGSVQQDMLAGKILQKDTELTRQGGIYELTASVRCEEMIARQVRASILKEETIP